VAGGAVGEEELAAADDGLALLVGGEALGLRSYSSFGGSAGPGASEATYAARYSISSSEKTSGLRRACLPGWTIGMRPVLDLEVDGGGADAGERRAEVALPSSVRTPSPFWPWQVAQPTRKSLRPCVDLSCWPCRESAVAGAKAA
jgi:hypothetical protein